jgi:serine/threonine protein kinase
MLALDIIHGDIKPQNVLIFKGDNGSFTAKVADFGFSTRSAHDDHHIALPESWPWYAPEIREYPELSPQQAAKTEVFSFGMLCLWFMFEKYLSGVLPLPGAAQSARSSYIYKGEDRSLQFLADLKKEDSLTQLASQLVMVETDLDVESRQMLEHFFRGCLPCDPKSRDVDIQYLLKHMNVHQYELLVLVMNHAKYCSRTQPIASSAVAEIISPIDHDFNVRFQNDEHRSLSDWNSSVTHYFRSIPPTIDYDLILSNV